MMSLFTIIILQVLQMAMAQVFIPNPHDSIPPLHLHTHQPSPSPSSIPSPPSSLQEDDHTHFLPRAPPPSPEVQTKRFGPIFEIDPSRFETPRKSELSISPSNSLEFSAMFTPNKSPLESEPQSPMQPSPGDPLDSAYSSTTHTSTSSRYSNAGSSSLSIPISPNSATSCCYKSMLSHSHSDADSFQNGLRSHTALAQHPNTHHDSSLPVTGHAPRPRSHTHPSHTLTPHAAQERQEALRSFHPHLPLSFEATRPGPGHSSEGGGILDSRYHNAIRSPPCQQKKSNLKRKSNELGYDPDPMDVFNYDSSFSETSSESEWLVVHPKSNKKACQEGENPIIRRQSSSFSGAYSYSGTLLPVSDGLSNMSAPPTPNQYTTPTPLLLQDFSSLHHPSLSPPAFSHHQTPYPPPTPTPSTENPNSLQSMEVAEQGVVEFAGNLDSLDSMDCGPGEHCTNMDSLGSTLRACSHLEIVTTPHVPSPPHPTHIVTVSSPEPSVPTCRSCSSGGYDFSLNPQLAEGPNVHYSSYDESQQSILNTSSNIESRLLLSKSL